LPIIPTEKWIGPTPTRTNHISIRGWFVSCLGNWSNQQMARTIVMAMTASELKAKVEAHKAKGWKCVEGEWRVVIQSVDAGEQFLWTIYTSYGKQLSLRKMPDWPHFSGKLRFLAQELIKLDRPPLAATSVQTAQLMFDFEWI
jgi:hypothetical protein